MARDRDNAATADSETVDQLVAKYRDMVTVGRALAPMAADNLDYWLSGKGGQDDSGSPLSTRFSGHVAFAKCSSSFVSQSN